MNDLPLHPALVHVPVGLALVMPVIAVAVAWALVTDRCTVRAWLLVVGLQAIVLGSAIAAIQTGEDEEERIEGRISESVIERHEDLGKQFAVGAGLALAVSAAAFLVRQPRPRRVVLAASVAFLVVSAVLAARAGHAGGSIVHGPGGLVEGASGALPAGGAAGGGEHDDDD